MRINAITVLSVVVALADHLIWALEQFNASNSTPQIDQNYNSTKDATYKTPNSKSAPATTTTTTTNPTGTCTLANRPAVYGLRCDIGCELNEDEGMIVVKANKPTALLLFGYRLDTSVTVALTPNRSEAQDDCTHLDRVSSLELQILSPTTAQVLVDLPPPRSIDVFYLCLRLNSTALAAKLQLQQTNGSSSIWFHQGTKSWLKLQVKQDLLPLFMKFIVIACLLALSGLFSGLNLGLMALDMNELQVISRCGSETEKRYARLIEPVRRRGNYLLCTILFSNVLVNSTIAVFLEELTSGLIAVMTSTIFIVMFGEILPQAFCSRHGLAVGAKTVSITYLCMLLTFPLSYPVSICLDWALGEEIGHVYDRERIKELIRLTGSLEKVEFDILSGALTLKKIQLGQVMTRIEDVFMIDMSSCLDFDTIRSIIECGYSRIPIYESGNRKNIVALLFAKDLALLDPDDKTPVQTMINFYHHPMMFLFEDTTLDLALNEFKTGKSHMAFIRRIIDDGDRDPIYEITGVVTLEDVIEEIIQFEINDETDTVTDNRRKRRRSEAQVRRDFFQFTNVGGDLSYNIVTPQLCLAAYQYLVTTVEPFSSNYIGDIALKRLLSQKIYYKVRMSDETSKKRLYTCGEAADYFILILEGRVHVVCGRENLIFDSGPFSYFGKSTLMSVHMGEAANCNQENTKQTTLRSLVNSSSATSVLQQRRESSAGKRPKPSNSITKRRESIAGWALNSQFSLSMKKLERLVSDTTTTLTGDNNNISDSVISAPTSMAPSDTNITANHSISESLSELEQPIPVPISAQQLSSDPIDQISNQALDKTCPPSGRFYMIPDYTVDIITNSSYLKITTSDYVAAIKETLLAADCSSPDSINVEPNGISEDLRTNYLQAITSLASATNNSKPNNNLIQNHSQAKLEQ